MKKIFLYIFFVISWIFIAWIQLHNVFSGNIPFWYDPARDMLAGWDNLQKFTLIGSTSGIPGIFYGPEWIWLLSFGELFSKDPRIVIFIVETIPYLILLPLGLYLFVRAKVFDLFTGILLWILFAYRYGGYISSIWNPNLTPLFFLFSIYFLITQPYNKITNKIFFFLFAGGFFAGLAFQFQISFGTGFIIGSMFFLLVSFIIANRKVSIHHVVKNGIGIFGGYFIGIFLLFIPFFAFEMRHGFMQTKVALAALSKGGGVVSLHGLTKQDILMTYIGKLSDLLQVSFYQMLVAIIASVAIFLFVLWKKYSPPLSINQKKVLGILGFITIAVLGIYLSAKNPVWSYHFIGAEIVVLLFVGILLSKVKLLQYILFVWICYLSIGQVQGLIASYEVNPLASSSLYTREYEVNLILKDAGTSQYAVFAYSPSIYTYEYSYLFRWLGHKDFSYDPGQIQSQPTMYLIIPPADQVKIEDFINYRTPSKLYRTVKSWSIPDGTIILKRKSS